MVLLQRINLIFNFDMIMKKFRIYPVSENGKILKGFCPTIVVDNNDGRDVQSESLRLMSDLVKYGYKFYAIKVDEL